MHYSKQRRKFLKNSTLAATSLSMVPGILWSNNRVAPSDQINIGLIGCRGRGFDVLTRHLARDGVNCVGICDVDERQVNRRVAEVKIEYNQHPKKFSDYRQLLENPDLDAVIIGTPDHWHCLPTVHACQAGKEVYVEKPMANTIEECRLMEEATHKYNRVVQVGQQQRSSKVWQTAMDYIKSGKMGQLRKVNFWANFNYGVGNRRQPDQPVPKGVDYDFWLGPAPHRPFNPNHYTGWRMFWDFGGGLMSDWGVHLIDMGLWAKDIITPPKEVMGYGENLAFEEFAHETFDTQTVIYPMEDYVMTWQHTAGIQSGPYDMRYGVEFVGDHGIIVADRGGWQLKPENTGNLREQAPDPKVVEMDINSTSLHAKNFLDCIKSREKPVCPPEIGGNVARYAHMGNIVARTNAGKLEWDAKKNKFANNREANGLVTPEYRKPWDLPKV